MYGPLPTAGYSSPEKSAMLSTFSQMCLGTIGIGFSSIEAWGSLSLMTSSWPLAVTLSKFSAAGPLAVFAASSVMTLLNVQAASSAVTGVPSDHLVSRILKVQVRPSSELLHDSARSGLGCSVLWSGIVRKLYICRWIWDDTRRTARNGFIESTAWVAPTRMTFFPA